MRELSLLIEVVPLRLNKDHRKYLLTADDYFHLQMLKTNNNAGHLIDCDQSIIIDKPEKSVLQVFSFSRSCIVRLKDSQGKEITLGTEDLPAQVIIVPFLNVAKLDITCKMLNSPFL